MTTKQRVREVLKYGVILFLCFILFGSTFSSAEEFRTIPEFGKGLLIYKPVNVDWQDIDLPQKSFFKYLKTASIILKVLDCEQRYIPLKVIYDSMVPQNSYSGYYQVDSKQNSVIKIKIFDHQLADSSDFMTFDRIEIDSTFAKCFGDAEVTMFTDSLFVLKLQKEKYFNFAWNTLDQRQGKPIIFNKLYSNNFRMASDSSYHFKGFVVPLEKILNKKDWYNIYTIVTMKSRFEKHVLGRPFTTGITNELAKIDRYSLKRGDLIRIDGNVSAGTVSLVISRVDGGIVKVALLNRGTFADEFRVSNDGDYSIFLSANMMITNYPYLDFKLYLRHLN